MKELLEEIKDLYNWIIKLITADIWNFNLNNLSKAKRRAVKYTRVAYISIKEAGNDKLGLYAVSLSFFATLSVVPFAAVSFAITGGIGMENRLQELLLESFSDNKEVLTWIIQFAENIIADSTKGLFGIISFLFFMGTVIWLILNIDKAFNVIWKVERRRSITRRFLYYIGVLIVAPFVILMFLSASLMFNNALGSFGYAVKHFANLGFLLQWGLFYAMVLLSFTIMYKYIPNVKVRYTAAFNSALITALAFIVVQFLYVETQLMVSRLNAVYGAFAAIPLFLIWMNISWTIILIGAEISHAYQYVGTYNNDKNLIKKDVIKK